VSDVLPKVLKLSFEISECKPLIDGILAAMEMRTIAELEGLLGAESEAGA
jgi:hypothetical protein